MKNKVFKIISFIINICLIIMITICIFKIGNWLIDNYKNKKIKNSFKNIEEKIDNIDINKIKEKENLISINELKKQNNDTVAWLKVNNTNINYPVVKTNNNDFYMNHSFDKTYNGAGWIFMDYRVNLDSSKNIVIYGHNRRDKSMFGSLDNILKEEWQKNSENKTILFITENKIEKYEVFSVYEVLNEEYYITTDFTNESYNDFLNTIKNRSIYNFNTKIDSSKNILTLSTCSNNDKYRTVLHAIKLD